MSNSTMRVIDGLDLRALLTVLRAADMPRGDIHTLRLDFRPDGVAVKINSDCWSPTIGRVQEAY